MEDLLFFSLHRTHTHNPPTHPPNSSSTRADRGSNEASAPLCACCRRSRQEQTNQEIYFIQSRSIMLAIVRASFTHCVPLLSSARAYIIHLYVFRVRGDMGQCFLLVLLFTLSDFRVSLFLTPTKCYLPMPVICVVCPRIRNLVGLKKKSFQIEPRSIKKREKNC